MKRKDIIGMATEISNLLNLKHNIKNHGPSMMIAIVTEVMEAIATAATNCATIMLVLRNGKIVH